MININGYKKLFYKQMFEESLDSRVKLSFDDALIYLHAISGYNNFDSKKAEKMLREIDELIPRAYYNQDNPNNGSRVYEIKIGRESSPVIYLTILSFQNIGKTEEIIEMISQNQDEFENIAQEVGLADEFNIEVDDSYPQVVRLEMRIWWD